MGLSNFFDNFLSGMAFGMIANNPFFGGWGGYGGGYYNTVDFGTFANPFPNVFGNSTNVSSQPAVSLFTTFSNPFPTIDFKGAAQSLWDMVTDPNSEFNKRMAESFKEAEQCTQQYNATPYVPPQIEFPFSSFYIPTQSSLTPFYPSVSQFFDINSYYQKPAEQASKTESSSTTQAISTQTRLTQQRTSAPTSPKRTTPTPVIYSAAELKNKWKSKTGNFPDQFFTRVIEISKSINCNPNDLMAIMNLESRGFQLNAVNPISGATGLIQFMPKTAKGLGTSTEAIAKMSALEQLEYVEKYLKAQKRGAGYPDGYSLNSGELYAIVFRPKYARRDYIAKQGEKAYTDNKVLDKNKDGYITRADLSSKLREYMA